MQKPVTVLCAGRRWYQNKPEKSRHAIVAERLGHHVVDILEYHNESQTLTPTIRDALNEQARDGYQPIVLAPSQPEATAFALLLKASGVLDYAIAVAPEDASEEKIEAALTGRKSEAPVAGGVKLVKGGTMKAKKVSWLIEGLIPKGAVTTLAGAGGSGKSSLVCGLLAMLTKGGFGGAPLTAALVNVEDDVESVSIPKLRACGADLDRILFPEVSTDDGGKRSFGLQDLEGLRQAHKEIPFDVLVVDPLGRFGKDLNKGNDVWSLMAALDNFAKATGVAVIGVCHVRKKNANATTTPRDVEAISGSKALSDGARVALLVNKLSDGRRFVTTVKGNYGPSRAIEFKLRDLDQDERDTLDNIDPVICEAVDSIGFGCVELGDTLTIDDAETFLQKVEASNEGGDIGISKDEMVEACIDLIKADEEFPIHVETLKTVIKAEYGFNPKTIVSDALWPKAKAGGHGFRHVRDSKAEWWFCSGMAYIKGIAGTEDETLELWKEKLAGRLADAADQVKGSRSIEDSGDPRDAWRSGWSCGRWCASSQ